MIFELPKPTTSLNGPFKIGPIVGRFREVLLYTVPYVPTEHGGRIGRAQISRAGDHGFQPKV